MDNGRNPAFEGERKTQTLMKNMVETRAGDIVEIINNGTLICSNSELNWKTIEDWFMTDAETSITLRLVNTPYGIRLGVDMDESVPTHKMGSLLEAFEYQ